MKNIFSAIVAKTDIKPEIAKVFVTKDKMVATNAYALIEVSRELYKNEDKITDEILRERFPETDILIPARDLDLAPEVMEVVPVQSEGFTYPDYKQLLPTQEKLESDYYVMNVNPQYLADIAKAIANTYDKKEYYGRVEIYIPKEKFNRPMILRRDDKKACALLMPINK